MILGIKSSNATGSRRPILLRLLLICTPLMLVSSLAIILVFQSHLRANQTEIKTRECGYVQIQATVIDESFTEIFSDLRFLESTRATRRLFLSDGSIDLQFRAEIDSLFLRFASAREIYDQIRFLDASGQEISRVNFDQGNPRIVPADELQDKKRRYYFTDTIALSADEVFISPLDLNVERGTIETPLKPVIRFGTPIADAGGVTRGVLLLNYLGDHMLNRFAEVHPATAPSQSMLINSSGYLLHGPDEERCWGFMNDATSDVRFDTEYPTEWELITASDSGQFVSDAGMFTFRTVHDLGATQQPNDGRYMWKIVSHLPSEALNAGARDLTWWMGVSLASVLLILGFASWRVVVASEAQRQALARAEHANRAKSQFLSNMSHEVRTPLNSIMGMIDLALVDPKHPDVSAYLATARNSAGTLLTILNDILDTSKIEAGKVSIEKLRIPLPEFIAEVTTPLKPLAEEKHLQWDVLAVGPVPSTFWSDPTRLNQCLSNLLSNAIKFTSDGFVRLLVSMADRDGVEVLRFEVVDSGIGIQEGRLASVFGSFEQEDLTTTRRFGGTGLGLSITRQLVSLLGGRISVESTQGSGSCFTLDLPLAPTDLVGAKVSSLDLEPIRCSPTSTGAQRFQGRILVAEDNPVNRRTAGAILGRLGPEVDFAENGREAVAMAAVKEYDLVLMDIQMPEMNGIDATRKLVANAGAPPIVALSANVAESDIQACLSAGCSGFMPKPINCAELIATLAEHLEQSQEPMVNSA